MDFMDGPYGILNDAGYSMEIHLFSSLFGNPSAFPPFWTGYAANVTPTSGISDPRFNFHDYKMIWLPGQSVNWFIDGQNVGFINSPNVWNFPAYWAALNESMPGVLTPTGAPLPENVYTLIDYVRLWCPSQVPNCLVGNDGQDDAWPGPG
jgi:hypothetical protein